MSTNQKVIKNNQSIVPFLGQRMSFIRGLDPLGLQNTSDATFSTLLPGLNNVTGRIRYYSFYCWLLDEYSKKYGNTDPKIQLKFIRTAEYIIALSSRFYEGDNNNIPGSNYAKKELEQSHEVYDLNSGIYKPDGTTANTYWNYKSGAFGQYYIGSLRDIGIVANNSSENIYARTNSKEGGFISGKMLADAFDYNIKNSKDIFLNCIYEEKITDKQLQDIKSDFNMTKIPEKSEEQLLLTNLLLQKDFPLHIEQSTSVFRKETIHHLLQFIEHNQGKIEERRFVYSAYDRKGLINGDIDNSLFGWYYYQFNEFWHYANTSILNGTLALLESKYSPNQVPLSEFIESISKLVDQKFSNQESINESSHTLEETLTNIDSTEYEYLEATSQSKEVDKVVNGFKLLFSIYLNNLQELTYLREYGESNELGREGVGTKYFLTQFDLKFKVPLLEFIKEYLFKNIIYRHQYVAFRKIRGGGLSTQKFIIEDHYIRYLGNFEAGYTGSRVGNLISFLQDLGLISDNNQLSEYGKEILNQLSSTNND